jgi:hypothetical protein
MRKRKLPKQKEAYSSHFSRLDRYEAAIRELIASYGKELAKLTVLTGADGSVEFCFKDYPHLKNALNSLRLQLGANISAVVQSATDEEWSKANIEGDRLVKSALGGYGAEGDFAQQYSRYFNHNEKALDAFKKRAKGGLKLSDRVWKLTGGLQSEMEAAIAASMEKGISAVQLSKKLSKYLTDFDRLKADYTERHGKSAKIEDCEYRSARLARTEINMAYRSAEQERWRQLDFVVGYEVKRSGREYPCEVCSSFAGKYPKDFVFVGWHPSCRCYVVPILKTEEEFWAWDGRGEAPTDSARRVDDTPRGFKEWIVDNQPRIRRAEDGGTLPYFLKDNRSSWAHLVEKKQAKGNKLK